MTSSQWQVYYYPGPSLEAKDLKEVNFEDLELFVSKCNAIVVCLGEGAYAEKPGDLDSLSLPTGQIEYVKALTKFHIPIIVVLITGRPRLLNGVAEVSQALLNAYVPGPMGGQAIAEIILGLINPSGKLPFTYPKHGGNVSRRQSSY